MKVDGELWPRGERSSPSTLASHTPPVELIPSVLDDLALHTLVHFKGPTDVLDVDDARMLMVYAMLYLMTNGVDDPHTIALRVVAPSLTPRFREALSSFGVTLTERLPGIHEAPWGPFALRVVETSRVCEREREHLLYSFSPRFLREPRGAQPLTEREFTLFRRIARNVAQFKLKGADLVMKDIDTISSSYQKALEEVVEMVSVEARLRGIPAEQRVAGLSEEERVADLSEGQRILLLPDTALRALSATYLATLPADIQVKIHLRLGD